MRQNLKDNTKAFSSRTLILKGFYSLMQTKHFREISITDIAERAGVSRLTFYRNFESKENVIAEYCSRIRGIFHDRISQVKEPPALLLMLNAFCQIMYAERESTIPLYRDSLLDDQAHRSWSVFFDQSPFSLT